MFDETKSYSKEFKSQPISLILLDKHPVRLVSKQLEVHENTLYRWFQNMKSMVNKLFQVMVVVSLLPRKKSNDLRKKIRN
ncbi:transposase [Listeria booriae]|uniref:Transposase n=1 Tax=Listeria booriae TaxID=1552123 RepID=A0A842ANJ4_9LIST|nr:transposase [Listeria booriae]MBC1618100.1 transposase [Listeria booriae]